ncbi:MFS transporter [Sphingomonas sp. AP4-R1]|uniref:MFS transporter n=1 Tax=Sphingomonas sp. AP4-R1 TaxID=2735134 RepID=UPI0014935716|nr:MFS transporter [Sphingomonas sp. AP4-R1]QJU58550.1 MFS transporter [Sphingomonas sp. AP4-R1]
MRAERLDSHAALPPRSWGIALVVTVAIAISYLDRQTLPWAIAHIQRDIPIGNQAKALLDSAFLATYGLMYLGGGWLLDRIGTRAGFVVIMAFWSLACASHGLAGGIAALIVSRLLLGIGEGGGFPAATSAIAECFPASKRATAMGIVNAGTSVGAVMAPPLIALLLARADWLGLASWRWVFFVTGAMGLAWAIWWGLLYRDPPHAPATDEGARPHTLRVLLARREVAGVVGAKFLSDGAWYFYLFWLPKYLFDTYGFDLRQAATLGWIPYAAAGIGSIAAGFLSSRLLARGMSVNAARKIALGLCAACMPWVMLVPHVGSVGLVLAIFSLAFFGQQGWSTLIMTLPTDMIPQAALGRLAGLVGMGGAFGGIVMGQAAGWALDHGYGYAPVLAVAASLHVLAFALICLSIPLIKRLDLEGALS